MAASSIQNRREKRPIQKWREHLYEMDYLQEGIGLRGYAQQDPLRIYRKEGFDMFQGLMEQVKEEIVEIAKPSHIKKPAKPKGIKENDKPS